VIFYDIKGFERGGFLPIISMYRNLATSAYNAQREQHTPRNFGAAGHADVNELPILM
jgi:hypothetical protein